MNKEYRYDVAVLRLLCIVVVVFFHAYGMTYANHFSEPVKQLYLSRYEFFNQTYFINIAMPMFIFISGFLFGGQLLNPKRNNSFISIFKNKFTRILIPYYVFTLLFMLTTNSLSWDGLYKGNYWHLWFLPMLFWSFILAYLLKPLIFSKKKWINILLILFFFIISFSLDDLPRFLGLSYIPQWFCWFLSGMMLYKYESNIFRFLNQKTKLLYFLIILILTCVYIVIVTIKPWPYDETNFLSQIATLSMILALWLLFNWIPWKNLFFTNFLISLSALSFGIYIFHNWLEMYMVSKTARSLLPIDNWAINHQIAFPLLFAITAFILSAFLTKLMIKTKVGKFLIG